jgi:NhaA family Na+:H+ antiporter
VAVIAVFYTARISWAALGLAAVCLSILFVLSRLGARQPLTYAIGGVLLWVAVLASGIHATIAGVALAMVIPSRTRLDSTQFLARSRRILDHFESHSNGNLLSSEEQQAAVHALEEACEKVQPPLHRMEHALHPWVTFFIMPIFALANAGVVISGGFGQTIVQPVALGVILGLLLGKPIGIMLAAWLAVRTGAASLPTGVTWQHIHGAGWLGGIGFTMSLFIAGLAFPDGTLLTVAKLGILTASLCAGTIGSLLLLAGPHAASAEHSFQLAESK